MSWREFFSMTLDKVAIISLTFVLVLFVPIPLKSGASSLFHIYYGYFLAGLFSDYSENAIYSILFFILIQLLVTYLIVSVFFNIWVYSKSTIITRIKLSIIIAIFIFSLFILLNFQNMKDTYFQIVGKSELDMDVCDKISSWHRKEDCYRYIMTEKMDPEFCKSIESRTYQAYCFEYLTREEPNMDYCPSIELDHARKDCWRKVAAYNKDPSICENIESGDFKRICLKETAIAALDGSICAKIIDKEMICDKHGLCAPESNDKEWCYRDVAVAKNDESVCEQIVSDYFQTICYYDVAEKTLDPSICEKIPETENQFARTKSDCIHLVS